jgi:hypothetical protein
MLKHYTFTVYFALSSRAKNYVSFYKLFETHEHYRNNNVIIAGEIDLPLITGSDHNLLNGGPYKHMEYSEYSKMMYKKIRKNVNVMIN